MRIYFDDYEHAYIAEYINRHNKEKGSITIPFDYNVNLVLTMSNGKVSRAVLTHNDYVICDMDNIELDYEQIDELIKEQ